MRGMRYQPQGGQSRLSALARSLGFTHAFNFGDGTTRPTNLVTGTPGISTAVNASIVGGPGGRAMKLTGQLGDRLEVAGNPFATSVGTYLWIDSGVDPGSNGQAVVQTRYGTTTTGTTGEQFGFQIRIIGNTINLLSAQIANRVSVAGRDNSGKLNVSAVSIAGDQARHAVFNRGRMLYGDTPVPTGFTPNYQHGTSAIAGAFDCTSSTVQYYALLFAPRVIPDEVLKALTANPWQLFEAPDDDGEAGAVVELSISPAAAPFTLTGFAPTITRGVTTSAAPGAAALTITGHAPSVTQGMTTSVSPAAGALAVQGYAPTVTQTAARSTNPAPAALTITGYAPTVTRGASLVVAAGAPAALTVRGYAPTITQANNVTPHYADATIMRLSSVRAVVDLGPDRLQRTAGLP